MALSLVFLQYFLLGLIAFLLLFKVSNNILQNAKRRGHYWNRGEHTKYTGGGSTDAYTDDDKQRTDGEGVAHKLRLYDISVNLLGNEQNQ